MIKSGGEWISSVDLENQLMAHPAVQEAAVIGIPTNAGASGRWPAWCSGREPRPMPRNSPISWRPRVARWQVPENWAFVAGIPKTAVGKFDKKVLRARDAAGDLAIERPSR